MYGGYSSGESDPAITIRSVEGTRPSSALSGGDDYSPDATGALPRSGITTSRGRDRAPQREGKGGSKSSLTDEHDRRLPEARAAIRSLWKSAKLKAAELASASKSEDVMEKSNAACDLDHIFEEMWRLRDYRETDWSGVLDFLQGVLKYTWKVEGGFEMLSVEQCEAIQEIVAQYLGPSTIDKDDVRSALKLLRAASFDPWAVISEDPKE